MTTLMILPSPDEKRLWSGKKAFAVIPVLVLVVAAFIAGLVVTQSLQTASKPRPDFNISTTTPQNGPAGSTEKTQLTVSTVNGFNSKLSYTLNPTSGLFCQSTSSSLVFTIGSVVELDCTSNSAGVYLLTITMTSSSASHLSTVSFTFTAPASVTVTGRVQVTGGDIPSDVRFAQGTVSYSTPTNSTGNYAISLPNFSSYIVAIENAVHGSCRAGVLNLRQNSTGELQQNYSCARLQYPTVTSGSCDLSSLVVNFTSIDCTDHVEPGSSYPVAVSGQVTWTLSDSRFTFEHPSCTLTGTSPPNLMGCTITSRVISRLLPSEYGTLHLTVIANYTGDASHSGSLGGYLQMAISPPPPTVTVSGSATSSGLLTHATALEFTNTATATVYKATLTSNNYDVTLPNLQQYEVTLFYANTLGVGGSCNAGTLTVQTDQSTLTADYSC